MDLVLHVSVDNSSPKTLRIGFGALPILIGRTRECAVVIRHKSVSKRHCQIKLATDQTGGLVVQDNGSRRGTFVNGDQITSSPIMAGDVLRVGAAVLRLEIEWHRKSRAANDELTDSDTDRLPRAGLQVSCEMCGRGVPEDEFGRGAKNLDDGRALCSVCGSQLSSLPGFGPLRFLRPVGAGACGTVHKALHVHWHRIVAVKELGFDDTASPVDLDRLLREIRIGLKLTHPNIVKLHEAPTDGSTFYMIMDYIQGEDLQHQVDEHGPLPLPQVAQLARDLAGALDYAHDKKVVHRDIKPRNVVLKSNGQAVLTDFALARYLAESRLASLTGTGQALGSPLYMSPEQTIDAKEVGSQTDVYSLAATLYFVLGGRPPYYDSTSLTAFFEAVTSRAPEPVTRWRAELPESISQSLNEAMRIDPKDRPARPGDWVDSFATALEEIGDG